MEETKLSDLKARAYDLIRSLEQVRAELSRVNNLIAKEESSSKSRMSEEKEG